MLLPTCHVTLCYSCQTQVFKGLVTATNEYGEIRIQFYVVTGGHDQMESAIQAFLATTNAYGQRPLDLIFSDNPAADDEWFKSQIPSIQASQDRLDEATSTENASIFCPRCRTQGQQCQPVQLEAPLLAHATQQPMQDEVGGNKTKPRGNQEHANVAKKYRGGDPSICKGRGPTGTCEFYEEDGRPK